MLAEITTCGIFSQKIMRKIVQGLLCGIAHSICLKRVKLVIIVRYYMILLESYFPTAGISPKSRNVGLLQVIKFRIQYISDVIILNNLTAFLNNLYFRRQGP